MPAKEGDEYEKADLFGKVDSGFFIEVDKVPIASFPRKRVSINRDSNLFRHSGSSPE